MQSVEHFLLTRFNLRLWPHNKRGASTQTEEWLRERVILFEQYTLPSMLAQTCQRYQWILLLDSESPTWLRDKMQIWTERCPQIKPFWIKPEVSRKFGQIFQMAVSKLLDGKMCRIITTYLDNDDAVARNFVEDIQLQLADAPINTVLTYSHGIQYFTELKLATEIKFKHNHFISLVEDAPHVKTVFGYGSHYFIWQHKGLNIIYSTVRKMWMEVVHSGNVDNDVWMTNDTRWILNVDDVNEAFGCSLLWRKHRMCAFIFRWIPHAFAVLFVHIKHKVFGHDWWK